MEERKLQIKLGNATEKFIAKTLRKHGYWVYNMPMKASGQPCDIFAAKGGSTVLVWLIDAKHVRDEDASFPFDRIEPNQVAAMRYAIDFAKLANVGFCVFFDRDKTLRWLPYRTYMSMFNMGAKSVNMNDLEKFEERLDDEDRHQR